MPAATRVALINHSSPINDLYNGQFCGGVLVKGNFVATATHCVSDLNPGLVDVVIGADNLCNTAPIDGERIEVAEIIPADTPNEHLSFLRLKRISANTPISIAAPVAVESETDAMSTGWGRADDGGIPPCTAKNMPLQIAAMADCASYFKPLHIAANQTQQYICATPPSGASLNTCQGDSGGPVVVRVEDQWHAAGLTLGGASCATDSPGIYISHTALKQTIADL